MIIHNYLCIKQNYVIEINLDIKFYRNGTLELYKKERDIYIIILIF